MRRISPTDVGHVHAGTGRGFLSAGHDPYFRGQAEQQFLGRNLQLVAARFNLDAARAAVSQAGLWNNPNLSVEQNIHNQFTGRWFDVSASGKFGVQVQQLLLLAGKRGNRSASPKSMPRMQRTISMTSCGR
jgi:outer membrane protein TolC